MGSISEGKNALRSATRKKLRELDSAAAEKSNGAICRNVEGLPEYQGAGTIFAFVGVQWEVDTRELLLHALEHGKKVAVPLCTGPGIMEARFIRGLDELTPGAYRIPEPLKSCPLCPPAEIEFAVIPCVSCDRDGMRLGQGGGFYDRFLEAASFPSAALCREIALAERIPAEPWDRPVDCVVTEAQVYRRQK